VPEPHQSNGAWFDERAAEVPEQMMMASCRGAGRLLATFEAENSAALS
jgi:hypothetical protein